MGGVRLLSWLLPTVEVEAIDWDAVYREQLPRVFNYFRYRGFDRATAEDLSSATFEKAWRARGRYRRQRGAPSTWLIAIARNAATDHLRRSRREEPLADASLLDETTPETAALAGARLRRLRSLVAELPPRERELLALKYGAGATNRAIAGLTGLGESNVGTILHRTVARLRERWDEERRDDEGGAQ
jgi:RNA polymerase sigma-70 factor (ECF subfamily)